MDGANPRTRRTFLTGSSCGAAGAALAGLWVARLTVRLNPQLGAVDAVVLLAYLGVGAAAVGALAGLAVAGLAAVSGLGSRRWRRRALCGLLALAPPLYAALLPGSGLAGKTLSGLLFGSRGVAVAAALAAVLLLAPLGLLLAGALDRLGQRLAIGAGRLAAAFCGVLAASVVVWTVVAAAGSARATARPALPAAIAAELARAEARVAEAHPPPRVLLLVADGVDPDDVLLPLVEAGELPTFARLLAEGTWGELATLEPTLSAVVWTTLATGKAPSEHGIHHFVYTRLPGIAAPIAEFPLHTGLNFTLLPALERLPLVPSLSHPYTSDQWRSEPLWSMISPFYPVGVYRWLITWPAQPVNGFNVAGGLGPVQFESGVEGATPRRARGALYPPDLFRRVRREPPQRATEAELRRYTGPEVDLKRRDLQLRTVVDHLEDPTSRLLPRLIDAFDARFTAAAFYSVDPFHHYFADAHQRGHGPYAAAITEAYRTLDARLGELLAAFEARGEPVNLLLVSDHGFDFEHHHHTWAPPGLFLAHGPAFAAGRRVEGLSVYDIAPLVLHLLDLPLADDLPGVASGTYRRALAAPFAGGTEPLHIATYEGVGERARQAEEPSAIDEELRETLKSLGYL